MIRTVLARRRRERDRREEALAALDARALTGLALRDALTYLHGLGALQPLKALPAVPVTVTASVVPPTCPGRLTTHQDGHTTCHGGRDDCWGTGTYTHRGTVSCQDIDHGCGICDPVTPATAPEPAPQPADDMACARCSRRPGTVPVAATGSLPTLVCQSCASAIEEGRTWHGTRTETTRA